MLLYTVRQREQIRRCCCALVCGRWPLVQADGQSKEKGKNNNSLLLRNRSVPRKKKKLAPWYFKLLFLLVLKMLDAGGTIHKAHKGCKVAAEKPFRFPGNSFCRDEHSNNATFRRKKISLFIQLQHLITFAINFQGEVK